MRWKQCIVEHISKIFGSVTFCVRTVILIIPVNAQNAEGESKTNCARVSTVYRHVSIVKVAVANELHTAHSMTKASGVQSCHSQGC